MESANSKSLGVYLESSCSQTGRVLDEALHFGRNGVQVT